MVRTIMVPLDGSPAAEHALPWALHLARQAGAVIKVVRVSFPPTAVIGAEGLASGDPGLYQALQKQEEEYLTQVSARHATPNGVVTADLLDGDDSAAGMLAKFVTTHSVDLTVMTTHGRGPFARFWLGSVADEFLRSSDGPTLLVRGDQPGPPAPAFTPDVKQVLVPLDGSDLAEQALEPAVTIGGLFGAEFTLLLVLNAVEDIKALVAKTDSPAADLFPPESAVRAAKDYLERKAEPIRQTGRSVRTRVIERGSATEVILTEAAEPGTLVCLATHGQGGLSRLLLGSVADKVVRGATGPVLIVRPPMGE
jgi:nucleotide-binding universal stress UspA family protein